ncbi:MAG: spermine synthase [Deltaproteobacteria bacterium CG03_land_8_20_14_0_80_45_14]|nr:MAG: spermine synthase [Deltaproteobacteria bacterium CG03_land_8_20_14_0_80_45_14]
MLLMGLSGITAQIVLLRELLVSFLGNELTLGVILANWMILVAIGSFLIGKSVEKVDKKIEFFVVFQLVFSLAFPFAIFLCRIFKNILLTTPGEALGFAPIWYSSFTILLPVSLPYGALFTYGCKLYSQYGKDEASSVGKVYLFETIGSIIGGLLLTFLMIQYLNSFEIAFLISLMNPLIATFLLPPIPKARFFSFRNILFSVSIFIVLFFVYLLLTPSAKKIDSFSINSQWRNLNVIHNENSIYGNISVTQRGEQFTFYNDGVPSITTPIPDIASIEDFVHFPMLFHKKPESVLILSGGAGGMIHEILKYPVTHVDYVELDPLLLKLVQRFSTPLTQSELSDQRVKIHYQDSRLFTQRTGERFDIIFIGLSAPQALQTNRLFSLEFFSTAKRKLNPNGILVLSLPGSLTYISPELRDLNGCILDTLKSVFGSVRIIPGDVNLYLASDSNLLDLLTPKEIAERLEERKIQTSLVKKNYIEYRLHRRWLQWYWKSMEGRRIHINSDFRPLGVFFNLSYWNALFSPYLTGIFKWFEGFHLTFTLIKIILITIILSIIFIKMPQHSRHAVTYSIFTTGLTGMIFSLALIFTFQTFYGFLYHQIGLLVAIFMAGIASGSFFITNLFDRMKNDSLLFLKTEIAIILFSILLPFAFLTPSHHLEDKVVYVILYGAILIMSFLSGMFTGIQFPLAVKIYLDNPSRKGKLGQTAGLLYGADLFGGFFGGLLGGVFLLPLLGLKETCFMMAMIKISSGLLFFLFMKIQKAK